MIDVVSVKFNNVAKAYYFSCSNLTVKQNDYVIVETEQGIQYGQVVTNIIKFDLEKLNAPLKPVIRIATAEDKNKNDKNLEDAKKAYVNCKKIIGEKGINMQLVNAYYTFDRDKLIFRFLSDTRIDFRALAKDLANIYKTRIELRQIGARDKAKEIGGCGSCGRTLCCNKFLNDIDSVSINMAKNQNVALNPNKINGLCGRLLCCLKYEDEIYKACKKDMPSIGQKIKTEKGMGKVISVDIFKRTYKVEVEGYGILDGKICEECN